MDFFVDFSVKEDSNDSESEHEEEFYYTEIEVNVENVTQGLSDMSTSSPSSPPERLYITDHDYQKKVRYGHRSCADPESFVRGGGGGGGGGGVQL